MSRNYYWVFFFHCRCRDHPSCSSLQRFSPFLAAFVSVSYCQSFLLRSPYFQSPECHKAPQQKETQFPELSLQTSSLQLKTAAHRTALFVSDTSASPLLQVFFFFLLLFFKQHCGCLKAAKPQVWNKMLLFPFTEIIFSRCQVLLPKSLDFSVHIHWTEFVLKQLLNSAYFSKEATQIRPNGHTTQCHKKTLMAARFIGYK